MQETDFLFQPVPLEKFQTLTNEQLIQYAHGQQDMIDQLLKQNKRLRALNELLEEKSFLLGEVFVTLKRTLFGKSSEKAAASGTTSGEDVASPTEVKESQIKKLRIRLPSERYPDAPLIEEEIELKDPPDCKCCGVKLVDSGMTEDREFITKIPEQFFVVRQKRHKYRCEKCHGDLQTAPSPPRIKEGSAFSDELIVDVAVKKFCDLIPIERQTKMAERLGMPGLPPQSLIETTHYLAAFLRPIYDKLKSETFASRVLHADETPHRMLEGSEKSHWFFWGFSGPTSAYFEAHGTRSGDVACELLKTSACEVLMSDVFSGYQRAVRLANEERVKTSPNSLPLQNSYCNAHARRKFKEAEGFKVESDYFIHQYQKIYFLEAQVKDQPPDRIREIRLQMKPLFLEMKQQALAWMAGFSSKSTIVRAISYFLKNYPELTLFTETVDVPIDNNQQERLLRNPVIGRKTWYGTHSIRGAETTAILFSVIESCKLNQVNPRTYLAAIVQQIHSQKPIFTPHQFKSF